MKQEKNDTQEVAVSPPPKPKPAAEKKFTKERLRRDCRALFDVDESAFDGALHGRGGEISVGEAKAVIKAWRDRKISKQKQGGKV